MGTAPLFGEDDGDGNSGIATSRADGRTDDVPRDGCGDVDRHAGLRIAARAPVARRVATVVGIVVATGRPLRVGLVDEDLVADGFEMVSAAVRIDVRRTLAVLGIVAQALPQIGIAEAASGLEVAQRVEQGIVGVVLELRLAVSIVGDPLEHHGRGPVDESRDVAAAVLEQILRRAVVADLPQAVGIAGRPAVDDAVQ